MNVGAYWRRLIRRLEVEAPRPDEYEVFDGRIVFWFHRGENVRELLKRMSEAGIPYEVQWDREEGFLGIMIRRQLLE